MTESKSKTRQPVVVMPFPKLIMGMLKKIIDGPAGQDALDDACDAAWLLSHIECDENAGDIRVMFEDVVKKIDGIKNNKELKVGERTMFYRALDALEAQATEQEAAEHGGIEAGKWAGDAALPPPVMQVPELPAEQAKDS